jgi:hypothetical protein
MRQGARRFVTSRSMLYVVSSLSRLTLGRLTGADRTCVGSALCWKCSV